MADLSSLFELEALDVDLFRSSTKPEASTRLSLYGGVVIGQALRAAGMTVAADRVPHSLHGYFLRPGLVDQPVTFHVDRDRDGGSFSARHVRAVQNDTAIFSMVASFQAPGQGVAYDAVPTRGGGNPDELPGRSSPLLVDIQEVTPTRVGDGHIRHSDRLWVRAATGLADDVLLHACVVAYMSDLGSGFGQTEIEGLGVDGPSIDHNIWFHEPVRADDWMLLELWPFKASSGRGMYLGSLRNTAGVLGAVIAQEMLLRNRALAPDVLERMAAYLGVVPSEDSAAPPPSQ